MTRNPILADKWACENPRIEKKYGHWLARLARNGFAKRDKQNENLFIVDWERLKRTQHIQGIGVRGWGLIREWIAQAQPVPYVHDDPAQCIPPDCPICRKFHQHNHGGLGE